MAYWLFKSEPENFSYEDLVSAPGGKTAWDGVRNYQARNILRDQVKKGDLVLIYHSRQTPPSAVGIAEIVKEGYPDPTALDKKSKYFDDKSSKEGQSRWICVDLKAKAALKNPVSLPAMRGQKGLANMALLKKGQRLSIQPVTSAEWAIIQKMSESGAK